MPVNKKNEWSNFSGDFNDAKQLNFHFIFKKGEMLSFMSKYKQNLINIIWEEEKNVLIFLGWLPTLR